jgi:hypothetical protein
MTINSDFDSRCSATAKSGKPCRAAATEGGLCFFHANPKRAAELGRLGGRRNRFSPSETPLPRLETAVAVRDAVAQLISDVYQGKMNPRVAANLAPLLNLQLRTIETVNLEQRIAQVEKALETVERDRKDTRS